MTRPCLLACALLLLAAAPARSQDPYVPQGPSEGVVVLPEEDYPESGVDPGALTDPVEPVVPAPPLPEIDPVETGGRGAEEILERKTNKRAISAAPRISGPTTAGTVARKRADGTAVPPAAAPYAVKRMIWTANRMIGRRYVWGGGHRSFADYGYDCSGAVSYALHAADLLPAPLVSGQLARWGRAGNGRWVTIYANAGHVYMTIAGLRLDTSAVNDPGGLSGPRWRPLYRSSRGFHKRHPAGL